MATLTIRSGVESTVNEDGVLTINPFTREIIVPENELVFGVYNEKDCERKQFQCPRYVGDNIDLTTCLMFVNYVSASGKTGRYQCLDVKAIDDDTVTFSWLLSSNVFDVNRDSTIYFSVSAEILNEDGTRKNVFGTRKAQGNSYETIENGDEVISEEHADIILQIISRIKKLEDGALSIDDIDEHLDENSSNPLANKAIFEALTVLGNQISTVDQTYNAESENAQSGKAVAESKDFIFCGVFGESHIEDYKFEYGKTYKFRLDPRYDSWGIPRDEREWYIGSLYKDDSSGTDFLRFTSTLSRDKVYYLNLNTFAPPEVRYNIDQTYNAKSENAQSGKAVKQAVSAVFDMSIPGNLGEYGSLPVGMAFYYIGEEIKDLKLSTEEITETLTGLEELLASI